MKKIWLKIKQFLVFVTCKNLKRDPQLWVFGEWFGTRANDNSCFLADYLCEKHKKIKVIWIANKGADLHFLNKNIQVVERDSKASIEILKKAGVTVVNQGIIDLNSWYINYCSGAVNVNLWHGIPWKHIFLDEFVNRKEFFRKPREKYEKYFSEAKYWLAPSDDLRNILITANYVKPENIITTGYPRNSLFYDKNKIDIITKSVKKKIGLNENSTIIAYMPTFRDKGDEVFSFDLLAKDENLVYNRDAFSLASL